MKYLFIKLIIMIFMIVELNVSFRISISDFIKLCINIALHGTSKQTYEERGNLLLKTELFKHETVEKGISILNANVNVVGLTYKLLKCVFTYIQHKKCMTCSYSHKFSGQTLILKNIRNAGFGNLQQKIKDDIKEKNEICSHCKTQSINSFKELKGLLLIETDLYSIDDEYEFRLSDIPERIEADNKK